MGSRFVLNSSYNVCSLPSALEQVVARGWQHSGLLLADNGRADFQVTGDSRWTTTQLNQLDDLNYVQFQNFSVLAPTGAGIQSTDTADDANGSDTIVYGNYSQTCTNPNTSVAGNCTVNETTLTNPYNRPTISVFSATGGGNTSTSALTVALGTCITFTLTDTNSTVHYIQNVPIFRGGTTTFCPTQSNTYTAWSRGSYGVVKGPSITVTLTGPTVATPTISPATGSFSGAQTVTVSSATAGASIAYTTDGSAVTQYSTLYTGPFTQQYTGTINAIAFKSGMLNSATASAALTIAGSPAQLAATTSSTSSNDPETAASVTGTNTASGSLVIVGIYQYDYANWPTSCTSTSGATGAFIKGQGDSGTIHNSYNIAAYAFANEPAGTYTYSCTWTAGAPSSYPSLNFYSFTGAALTSPVEGAVSNVGTNTNALACGSVVTTGTNELLVQLGEVPYGNTAATSTGTWTAISGPAHVQSFYQLQNSAGTFPLTQSETQPNAQTCIGFAIKHN